MIEMTEKNNEVRAEGTPINVQEVPSTVPVKTESILKGVEKVVEKPYTFRKLAAPDIFLMFKIISAIGINEFTACFGKDGVLNMIKSLTKEEKAKDTGMMLAFASVALEVANVIFANVGKCEKEVYQLLAQTSNLSVEEITAEGNAIMFVEMVIDFVKKDEFPNFIKVVSILFK